MIFLNQSCKCPANLTENVGKESRYARYSELCHNNTSDLCFT